MKPVKNAIEGLCTDRLLVSKLVAELDGEGGGLFVKFEGQGRHEKKILMTGFVQ